MTKDEAIEIIDTLTECEYTDNEKRKEACNMAIEALKRDDPEIEFKERFERSRFCGYTLKELLAFADACRRQGISEEHLHVFYKNAESAFKYIMEIITENAKKSFERTLS